MKDKEKEKNDNRPFWRAGASIKAAIRLANRTVYYLNQAIVPLCKWCGLSVSEEDVKFYYAESVTDFSQIEESFVNKTLADVEAKLGEVVSYLGEQVKAEARTKFAGLAERVAHIKAPKYYESYYEFGNHNTIYFEDIAEAIHLNVGTGEMYVSTAEIEMHYTHFLDVGETAEYEKQKDVAKALNDFFRGHADWLIMQGAFYIVGGEVCPNTRFNYKLLNTK